MSVMMNAAPSSAAHEHSRLSDEALTDEVHRAVVCERQATARLVALLAEFDARRLYLGAGCSSMFTYCTQVLHLSEHAAYGRIEAARAGRRFPLILDWLAEGALTLTAVTLLAAHLTPENHRHVLEGARHRSKREVEQLVAALRPQPDVPATVRKLPGPSRPAAQASAILLAPDARGPSGAPAGRATGATPPVTDSDHAAVCAGSEGPAGIAEDAVDIARPALVARPAVVAPLAPERFKIQFTVGRKTHDHLRRAQDLLRHSLPSGDIATIFDRALARLVQDLERRRLAATGQPRRRSRLPAAQASVTGRSRHIPASVRREVWRRDGGRCVFVGRHGRCRERAFLEFHHVVPYAMGGETTAENLQLRCRAHNLYEAEQTFGPRRDLARESPAVWT
jgi:5-methylcytosine-specific restriction endonuclease McrA